MVPSGTLSLESDWIAIISASYYDIVFQEKQLLEWSFLPVDLGVRLRDLLVATYLEKYDARAMY